VFFPSAASLLFSYSQNSRSPGFRKTTLTMDFQIRRVCKCVKLTGGKNTTKIVEGDIECV
jgi:hypothetical protein